MTKSRPIWWTERHERALLSLPDKFTPVLELNADNCIAPIVYEQLVQAGYAECLYRDWIPGMKPQEHLSYRRFISLAESV